MSLKLHWENVYHTKESDQVSWYQREPRTSLRLLEACGLDLNTCLIDIGGGDSRLVTNLIARGLRCITVLDISGTALARARARLSPTTAAAVTWLDVDVTSDWSAPPVDIWHDRAVFHFLTASSDRARYLAHLRQTVKPTGSIIMGTFAPDGPPMCSGLPVMRYSECQLAEELGSDFSLVAHEQEIHRTPSGATQTFCWARFKRAKLESAGVLSAL